MRQVASNVRHQTLFLLFLLMMGAAIWLGFRFGDVTPVQKPLASVHAPGFVQESNAAPLASATDGSPIQPEIQAGNAVTPIIGNQRSTGLSEVPLTGGERIEQWLTSSSDLEVVAHNIIEGFASLKPEDHALAAAKLVAFIKDEHFADLKPLLMDPATSEDARNIIYQDLLRRPASTRLQLMFTLMQAPDHPFSDKARQSLARDLGADYGANFGLWQAKIRELEEAQK